MTDKTWKSLEGSYLVMFHKLNCIEIFNEPIHFYYKKICLVNATYFDT